MHQFSGYAPAHAARPRPRHHDKEKNQPTIIMERERQAAGNAAASASAGETGKLNQIVQHFYLKAALVILKSRVELPPLFTRSTDQKKVDRWFNLEIDDTNAIRESLHTWRTLDLFSPSSPSSASTTPPPLYLETYLDATDLLPNQSLVILDARGRRWDALEGLYSEFPHLKPSDKKIVLERWKIHLHHQAHPQQHATRLRDPELAGVLATLYKKLVLVFRALYSYAHYMPAYDYVRKTAKGKRAPITATSASAGLKLRWRVREGSAASSSTTVVHDDDDEVCPNLSAPLYRTSASRGRGGACHHYGYAGAPRDGTTVEDEEEEEEEPTTTTFDFGTTDSPAGALCMSVRYRMNCDFRVDDSEALLSSRFMDDVGVDETDALFRPTLRTAGEAAAGVRQVDAGDPLDRIASARRDMVASSARIPPSLVTPRTSVEGRSTATASVSARPSPSPSSTTTPLGQAPRNRERTESLLTPTQLRRPSLSFPIFKTPTLSSSPKRASPFPSTDHLAGANTSRPASRGTTLFHQHTSTPSSESARAREIPHHPKRAATTAAATATSRRGTLSRAGSTSNDAAIAGNAAALHGFGQQYYAVGAGAGAGANTGGIAMSINTGVSVGVGMGTATGSSPSTSAGSSRPKYSSSFSHRRSRLSLGGLSSPSAAALTEDNTSSPLSRRASLVSVQQAHSPVAGSACGVSAGMNMGAGAGEGGRYSASASASPSSVDQGAAGYGGYGYDIPGFAASLGSMHADEENISEFLKLLESSKDLMRGGGGGGRSVVLGADAAAGGGGGGGSASPSSGERGDAVSSSVTASQQLGGTTISALSRFHRLRESNQQLSDSMSNSFLLQQHQQQHRPTTASSSSSPRQHLLQLQGSQSYQMSSTTVTPPIPAIATSVPMGAMSISPHTPAIPSRLSAASNIDYGDEIGGGAGVTSGEMAVPPPMTAPETEVDLVSPVTAATAAAAAAATAPVTSVGINEFASVDRQESSSDAVAASTTATTAGTEMPDATTTVVSAAPIDIPSSSPRRYLLSTTNTHRRPVSAAPKPRGRAAEQDEADDFLPFVKTLSLGNEDGVGRAAPSVGELLRGRSGVSRGPVTSAGAADGDGDCAHGNGNGNGSGKGDVESSRVSSPRLAEDERIAGTGADTVDRIVNDERLPAQPSFSSLDSGTAPTTSAISAAANARRSVFLPHRPSFHRPQPHKGGIARTVGMQRPGSVGSLEEDEPLLFAMSDVGASRRSLEWREREKENRRGGKREVVGVGADVEMAEQMDLEN